MSRTKRILRGVGYGIGILIIVVLAAVLILAQTDWARNQVRQIALTQLADVIEGDFTLERIEGNLLRGPSLINITIVDGEGRPFVQADTLTTIVILMRLGPRSRLPSIRSSISRLSTARA